MLDRIHTDAPEERQTSYGPLIGWQIMLPGSVLGLIVGYATQRYGKAPRTRTA